MPLRKKAVLLFSFLLYATSVWTQAVSSDSLQIVQAINQSFSLHRSHPDSAFQIAEKGLKLAGKAKDSVNLINLWRIKGLVRYGQHNLENALAYFEQSYVFCQKINHGKSRLLINLGNTYFQQQAYETAAKKYEQALEFNIRGDTLLSLDALNNLGSVCMSMGRFEDAVGYYEKSLNLQKAIDRLQIPTYVNIAQTYYRLNQLDSSIAAYKTAIDISEARRDTNLLTIIYRRLGNVYKKQGAYFRGIQVFQKALDLVRVIDNPRREANILFGMGSIFYDQKNYDASLNYCEQALAIAERVGDYVRQSSVLILIGNNYQDQYLYAPALAAFQRSQQITEQQGLKKSQMYPLFNIGETYEQQNRLDSAYVYLQAADELAQLYNQNSLKADIQQSLGNIAQKRGRLSAAVNHYQNAIKNAQSEGLKKEEAAASKLLADLLKQLNRPSEALFHLERHLALRDALFNEENTQKIAELEASYQFEKEKRDLLYQNEVEKQKLDNEIQRQRTWQLVLVVALLLSLLALFLYRRTQLLNAQINSQQLQYEQQERERLEALAVHKSRFFTNIAHELRTPLTLILGPVGRLLKKYIPNEENKSMLELIQNNAQHLLSRVNEILTLAKVESEEIPLQNNPTLLNDFLLRLTANFDNQAQQKSQRINLDYQPPTDLTILLDQSKFQHIFNNFLSNALKFTPEGGQITVSLSEVATDNSDQMSDLLLEVKDNGIGIPSKDIPHVFERFYQSDRNGINHIGAGIGLALCREMATLMQGEVGVKSQLGGGSLFYFRFPLKVVAPVRATVVKNELAIPNKTITSLAITDDSATILVVEDNVQLNDYLQLILGERFQVVAAKNGKEALEKLATTSCNLILSDIMMPVMDGFELLERLKASDQYRHLPIIMLTAKSNLEDKLQALRIGVDDYLVKPFEEEELLVRIHNLLQNQQNRTTITTDAVTMETIATEATIVSNSDLQWLAEIETILKKEVSNSQYTFDQLANQLFISRSQLQRRLKKITGLTPNKYFREIRLQMARELLEAGQVRTIKEVSYAVGFETTKYFSKIYEERFGRKPKSVL